MKKLRQEFADTMLEVGQKDPKLVVLVGDISHGILQKFAQACPGRYYNIGICEPTIVNMAAGVSKSGLIPVVHTIAPFLVERAYEQIKLDFGYQKLGVNLISVGSAFDYSQLGCSHHCYADISLFGHFKRAKIFYPGSPLEFNILFKKAYFDGDINYFRLTEFPHGVEFSPEQIKVGKGIKVKEGRDVTLVTMGAQLKTVIEAEQLLRNSGIEAEIVYIHTIKPFDQALVYESVLKTKRVLVIEEASAHDGLFNYVLRSTLAIRGVTYSQIAIEDFIHGYGSYHELCEEVGLTVKGILGKLENDFGFSTYQCREGNQCSSL